jgi:multidrug efflux pump subunit AcrA (membrane-fusion protein)
VEVGPRTYERRKVVVETLSPPGSAAPVADRVAVRAGLSAGDRVVVNGAFTLKSEMGKAGFSHDH